MPRRLTPPRRSLRGIHPRPGGGPVPSDADVFHAIADPTRRRLLDRLERSQRTVNDLAAPFRMSRPAISQHLAILRNAGLVESRRDGRRRVYRIVAIKLREVHDWVSHYEHFWQDKLHALGEYLKKTEPSSANDTKHDKKHDKKEEQP